jgi:hypothetical protein
MPWKAYSIIPIDFRWELLPSVEEVAARMAEDKAVGLIHGLESNIGELDRFFSDLQHAHTLARDQGWEGDYSDRPRVLWLPDQGTFSYGFVWKQANNGSTFVILPHPLPWLDALI